MFGEVDRPCLVENAGVYCGYWAVLNKGVRLFGIFIGKQGYQARVRCVSQIKKILKIKKQIQIFT